LWTDLVRPYVLSLVLAERFHGSVWANAAAIGNTITDGTVVWTNIGKNICRGEVFAVELK